MPFAEILFWTIFVFIVCSVGIPVAVNMTVRAFLRAKHTTKLEYLAMLKEMQEKGKL